ncbi:PhoH family protein [Cyclobacterium marinum]|uniref:PhoH-like protein n=1 Tax=Cyclobacterium marinum (strain ATCC 25205 / DSM 745 / LMG 13164 / NCIMB 1802) TaxID=880070 RepID=G0J0M8_CYCMS|nr:PhoH family protein [Cyclobacterium marinum]AEL24440.1 PhoH family protein [Cyclobacterium marinum DSM 745]MBI0399098.1 PhoH family protein [Cyclobacterium marinum]MBR9773464.1 PhoH family protein [Cytophagales bacterium]
MVEKVITLENVSLLDFLGSENENIRQISAAFPQSKIVSRGNEIRIKGQAPEILKINDILNMLLEHFNRYGLVTPENVKEYIDLEGTPQKKSENINAVILYGNKGVIVRPKSPNQKKLVDASYKNDLVFALGPAGTGKTYIAVALAVRALKNREVKRIIITRPAVEAGENLGFLPGDLQEKLDPYLRPIYDALSDMVPTEKLRFYQENRVIEIAPLAYMRGRTLHDAFVLLDEAQNTTSEQIKMFLTRMGPNSKVIITGDQSQVDLPTRQKSGLRESLRILKGVKGIGVVNLSGSDVVRHKLVKSIIEAYEKNEVETKPSK